MISNDDPTSAQSPTAPRNLVICCDGTGNIWGASNDTNVVHLVRWCAKDERQVVYYDPGVGTADWFPEVDWIERVVLRVKLVLGLALGSGVYENIAQAYEFLVHNYRPDDRIFLFGFSRGAFTARCIGGLVNLFGIVRPCAAPLLPLLIRSYFSDPRGKRAQRAKLAADIKRNFTDDVGASARVHFIGVWDTVSSVGGIRRQRISADPNLRGKRFDYVRHAVSEGESRASYKPRLFEGIQADEPSVIDGVHEPSLRQVWFAGAHSDVGGSYAERGLSDITLGWMLEHAERCGLRHDGTTEPRNPDARAPAHDQALMMPLWALDGLERRKPPAPELCHESLRLRLADPALRDSPRIPLLRHAWFQLSFWASLSLLAVTWMLSAAIDAPRTSALELARIQLTAPWADARLLLHYQNGTGEALLADVGLIAAYTVLLTVCSVYAVRRLRAFRPSSERTHGRLRYLFQCSLLAAPVSDLLENAFTLPFLHDRGLALAWCLCSCAAIKTLSLSLLVSLFVFAWIAPRQPLP